MFKSTRLIETPHCAVLRDVLARVGLILFSTSFEGLLYHIWGFLRKVFSLYCYRTTFNLPHVTASFPIALTSVSRLTAIRY